MFEYFFKNKNSSVFENTRDEVLVGNFDFDKKTEIKKFVNTMTCCVFDRILQKIESNGISIKNPVYDLLIKKNIVKNAEYIYRGTVLFSLKDIVMQALLSKNESYFTLYLSNDQTVTGFIPVVKVIIGKEIKYFTTLLGDEKKQIEPERVLVLGGNANIDLLNHGFHLFFEIVSSNIRLLFKKATPVLSVPDAVMTYEKNVKDKIKQTLDDFSKGKLNSLIINSQSSINLLDEKNEISGNNTITELFQLIISFTLGVPQTCVFGFQAKGFNTNNENDYVEYEKVITEYANTWYIPILEYVNQVTGFENDTPVFNDKSVFMEKLQSLSLVSQNLELIEAFKMEKQLSQFLGVETIDFSKLSISKTEEEELAKD